MEQPKMVYCHKLKKQSKALDKPPLPGPLGEEIYEKICAEAWQMWLAQQTILINEQQLNLVDPKARSFLQDEMKKFFFSEDYDTTTNFVSPKL